ncbi:signal peptidase II [Limosilactobacillus reuteri]|uniref:Lipoprotein signal peptidase n=2 Tax=Limosilactobacillus reuteri TaxID=1598 RepID=A0A1C1Z7K0_LIMRT|nr:signal peptidase II [Limosilactobacillus reuteri]AGN99248.1 lipoprotein signal peptidase [Limosilactobacillus reuteri I5007]MCC4326936.1 signal peptidase II [Limosilactobacillus reuteri]MCC4331662.1 signal peptidase II [Limosilactobacillus reuteri]MCC4334992.1 signal peptidase II [Limosilactobacillus reuteri]MCC4337361.1 signal peptidase II [Limosilactobacillus reuteri]
MLLGIAIGIILILTICDQLLKSWVASSIVLGGSKQLIPGIIELTNLRNSGAAWSIFEGQQTFFTIITIVAIIVIGYFIWQYRKNIPMLIGLSLIMAGTIGNFIDRLRQGYVVDMFETTFINFPIFNIADMCLTIGVIWLIICILKEKD